MTSVLCSCIPTESQADSAVFLCSPVYCLGSQSAFGFLGVIENHVLGNRAAGIEPGRRFASGSSSGDCAPKSLDRMHEQLFPAAALCILIDTPRKQPLKRKPVCVC